MTSSLRSPLRVLAWTAAIALVAAALLDIVLGFNILSAPPVRAEGSDFIDFLEIRFAWDRDRLPLDIASAVLYSMAFLAMAGVGLILGRSSFGAGERGSILATAFLAAGILGAAAQLVYLGAAQLAADPAYCDCGYRAEEVLGRLEALHVAVNQQLLLTQAALVAAAVGFFTAAGLGRAAGWSGWWPILSTAIGAMLLAGVAAEVLTLELVPELIMLATVGLLIPAWAIGLARTYPQAT
jgi:hypothetical protein